MQENIQSNETVKRGPGQPKSIIDWKKVDELLIAGCTAPEIAGYFGCSVRTLYTRCETDNNVLYSEYSQEKCSKGDSILRAHQYAKALGLTEKGDNTLLIWLGKTRLKQKEDPLEFSQNITVNTIDYSTAESNNTSLQISSETLPSSSTESP